MFFFFPAETRSTPVATQTSRSRSPSATLATSQEFEAHEKLASSHPDQSNIRRKGAYRKMGQLAKTADLADSLDCGDGVDDK
jgi:hypothetical protein